MKIIHYYKNLNSANDGISTLLDLLRLSNNTSATNKIYDIKKSNNGDILIYHGCYELSALHIAYWAKKKKLLLYWCPHGSLQLQTLHKSKFKKLLYHSLISRVLIFIAQKVIFVSKGEQENSSWLVPKQRGKVIHNGISLEQISLSPNNACSNFEERNENLFVGRIDIFHKGIDTMKYYAEKTNQKIDIYGPITHISQKQLGKNLNYKGILEKEVKLNTMKKYKKIIMLSRYEGLPMSLIEAMSVGCIPIVTKETNVGDLIKEYNCGYVVATLTEFHDAMQLFDKIEPKIKAQMSMNCIKLVRENFDIRNTQKNWRELHVNKHRFS